MIQPTPDGWKVWRGSVPPTLVQLAIDARDHINRYAYGTIVKQVDYNGQPVAIFKSSHTYTTRNGQLVTGICIPGISLLVPAGAAKGTPGVAATPNVDALLTPDPNAALLGADDAPDWGLVIKSGLAVAAVAGLFWWGLQAAGRARH